MHLEFRHLRVLLTVAEAGSIRKAAARLQLSLVPERRLTIDSRRSVHTLMKALRQAKCDMNAAKDLYGATSPEYATVAAAWTGVNVP